MTTANPYQQYQQNAVLTADPGRLTLLLFNGAAKFARQAVESIKNKDIPGAHQAITRAQDIVFYLLSTVNTESEVGKNLSALYDYMHRRLVEANVKKDISILEEVSGMLEDLGASWQEAIKQAPAQQLSSDS
ncbi:MAG: flagellar export chaperone FliS [Bacillota bacterium]